MADTGSISSPQQRVIRVFVSSTFQDMHAEREELVEHAFPQLRKASVTPRLCRPGCRGMACRSLVVRLRGIQKGYGKP